MMDNQTDFENNDVPTCSKRLNDATPEEWDNAYHNIQYFKAAEDKNVNNVVESYLGRAEEGMVKYGATTSANPLELVEWLRHLQEELMDATVYIERTIEELNK